MTPSRVLRPEKGGVTKAGSVSQGGEGICCFKHTQYVGDSFTRVGNYAKDKVNIKKQTTKRARTGTCSPEARRLPGSLVPMPRPYGSMQPQSTHPLQWHRVRQIHQVTALNGNGQVGILKKCHPNRQDRPEQTIPWAENKPQKQTE